IAALRDEESLADLNRRRVSNAIRVLNIPHCGIQTSRDAGECVAALDGVGDTFFRKVVRKTWRGLRADGRGGCRATGHVPGEGVDRRLGLTSERLDLSRHFSQNLTALFAADVLDLLLEIGDRAIELSLLHTAPRPRRLAPRLFDLRRKLAVLIDEILHRERQLVDTAVENPDVRPEVGDFNTVVIGLLDFRTRRSPEIRGLSERILLD